MREIVFRVRDLAPPSASTVVRVDNCAVLRGPLGERVVLDRHHVELAALALGCKLVEAGSGSSDPRRDPNGYGPVELHAQSDVEIPLDDQSGGGTGIQEVDRR